MRIIIFLILIIFLIISALRFLDSSESNDIATPRNSVSLKILETKTPKKETEVAQLPVVVEDNKSIDKFLVSFKEWGLRGSKNNILIVTYDVVNGLKTATNSKKEFVCNIFFKNGEKKVFKEIHSFYEQPNSSRQMDLNLGFIEGELENVTCEIYELLENKEEDKKNNKLEFNYEHIDLPIL